MTDLPEAKMPHIKFLDGLRCLAISWVFLFHMEMHFGLSDTGLMGFMASRGWMGVDLFFVISGFLITSILLREHYATGRISLPRFYMRRGLRIWPAYYLLVLLLLGVTLLSSEPAAETTLATIKWPAMYLTDMYAAYANTENCAMLHSWSLAIEEQFYLLWPLLLFWNVKWSKRIAILAVIGIALWRTWLTFHLPEGVIAMRRTYYAPDTRMDQILYGAILAFVMMHPVQSKWLAGALKRRAVQIGAIALFLAALYFNVRWSGHIGNAVGYSMTALSMALGLGYLITAKPRWILAALEWGPIMYVGRISYGMYLVSPFVIGAVRWAVPRPSSSLEVIALGIAAYAGTVLVATLSYRYFEAPFLRLKAKFSAQSRREIGTRLVAENS